MNGLGNSIDNALVGFARNQIVQNNYHDQLLCPEPHKLLATARSQISKSQLTPIRVLRNCFCFHSCQGVPLRRRGILQVIRGIK